MGEEYWISGCKRDGTDRLYAGMVEIDEDVAEEYWGDIRGELNHTHDSVASAQYVKTAANVHGHTHR